MDIEWKRPDGKRDLNLYPLVNIGPRPAVIGRETFFRAYSPSSWAKYFALSPDDLTYLLECEAKVLAQDE